MAARDEATRAAELERALPRRGTRREMWVGIFTIVGVLAAVVTLLILTSPAMFRGRYVVNTVVPSAGGIRRGDPVQMRGVNIGRIQGFEMTPEGVAIALEIEGEYEIPQGSEVVLRSGGLLGGRIADVVPGEGGEDVEGGAVLPGSTPVDILESGEALAGDAQLALQRINALLSEPTVDAVGASAIELRGTLAELSQLVQVQRRQLATLTASLGATAAELERATGDGRVSAITTNAREATLSLAAAAEQMEATAGTLDRASSSLETVLARLERGEGTLGLLSADEELYRNMNEAALTLRALLLDIRENPRRYIDLSVF